MKNNTTPPKPTIREKIKKILDENYHDYWFDTDLAIAQLLALLSPQTGEGEKKWLEEISCQCEVCKKYRNSPPLSEEMEWEKVKSPDTFVPFPSSGPCNCSSGIDYRIPCPVHSPPTAEDMEWEKAFDEEFVKFDSELGEDAIRDSKGNYHRHGLVSIKAFLRKQLDLQEKRYEKIVDDLDLMLAIGESVEDAETAKIFKNIRAELRSKLSSKK